MVGSNRCISGCNDPEYHYCKGKTAEGGAVVVEPMLIPYIWYKGLVENVDEAVTDHQRAS